MSDHLLLRRTPEEIYEYNSRFSTSLGILKILNLLPPRDWRFTFTFVRETTILSIQTEPQLTVDEFRRLADGTIPEVFNAATVCFRGSATDAVRCAPVQGARLNTLPLVPWTSSDADFRGLQLVGFSDNILPPAFQNASHVRQHLYELTWFGSHYKAYVYRARSFRWDLFGAVATYGPSARGTLIASSDPVETFECQVLDAAANPIGVAALVATSSRGIPLSKLYHSRLGLATTSLVLKDWLPREHARKVGLLLEIDENTLNYGADGAIGPYDSWKSVCAAFQMATQELCRSHKFSLFMDQIESAARTRSAKALAARQDALRARARVYYGRTELGCVPASENEVVVMLAKLEAIGGIPMPLFRLLEYTPRQGIDALGDFQLSPEAAPERLAPIEVEFHFENFLRHGHAIEQVRLIVCWGFGSASTAERAPLRQQEQWLYTYTKNQYSVSVVVLSRLPGLMERSGGL